MARLRGTDGLRTPLGWSPAGLLLCLVLPGASAAQELRAVLLPDTISVGDVARLGVRTRLPPGGRIAFPDSLPIGGDLENAGRVALRSEEHEDGGRTVTAVYPLTAWRPGTDTLPPLEVVLEVRSQRWTERVALPPLAVRSVLPADTTGVEARPPKDVVGSSRVWWLWLLLGLLAAAAIAALLWWWLRRRRSRPVEALPAPTPRERALGELEALRRERLLERGELEPFYERVSAVLRGYLSDVDSRWGRDRTTTELAAAILPAATPEQAARLRVLLREADAVKFAGDSPAGGAARRHIDDVRGWIEEFPPPPPPEAAEPGRAA